MLRVLLVLEDYGEQVFLQILLSKLGFDIGTVKNPKAMNDSVANLNPDVVILTAKGKRVMGTELSGQIKRIQGRPKIVLTAPLAVREKLTKKEVQFAEAVLESPVSPNKIIETLCIIGNMDSSPLLEKYRKLKPQLAKSAEIESVYLQGGDGPALPDVLDVRSPEKKKYEKFLKLDEPPPQKTFDKTKIVDFVKDLRREPLDHELDRERQAFVSELFKKKA